MKTDIQIAQEALGIKIIDEDGLMKMINEGEQNG